MNSHSYQKAEKTKTENTRSAKRSVARREENHGDWGMSAMDALRVKTLGK